MSRFKTSSGIIFAAMGLLSCALLTGCSLYHKQHADEKGAVTTALDNNGLGSITVTQNRNSGMMTLTGEVKTQAQVAQATNVAKQAAPDYTISNDAAVVSATNQGSTTPSPTDAAIENSYKTAIKDHNALEKQNISFTAQNGKLVLKGSVRTEAEKREAEELAKKVPHVQQVVNNIQVERARHPAKKSA